MIDNTIINVGVLDTEIDLFESQYKLYSGMRYNSYVVVDEDIAIIDTVETGFCNEWLDNIAKVVGDKQPKYLIIQHVEPDHSSSIKDVILKYPSITVVASAKALDMISKFYHIELNSHAVKEGETISLGNHQLSFFTAPMVHWPEVIVTYDSTTGTLFSADAFGRFGCECCLDDINCYANEARRYYYGIVGKYGKQVKMLINKLAKLEVSTILSSHGCAINKLCGEVVDLYNTWADSMPENNDIMIAYTSVYGNTKKAVEVLRDKLHSLGKNVYMVDIARSDDIYQEIANSYKYGTLVLATTTYNMSIFPAMYSFVHHLTSRGYCNHKVAIVGNGSWAPVADKNIVKMFEGCQVEFVEPFVTINSSLDENSSQQLDELATALAK